MRSSRNCCSNRSHPRDPAASSASCSCASATRSARAHGRSITARLTSCRQMPSRGCCQELTRIADHATCLLRPSLIACTSIEPHREIPALSRGAMQIVARAGRQLVATMSNTASSCDASISRTHQRAHCSRCRAVRSIRSRQGPILSTQDEVGWPRISRYLGERRTGTGAARYEGWLTSRWLARWSWSRRRRGGRMRPPIDDGQPRQPRR